MTLLQALRYFLREASMNLLRSWKVSLVAVLTIGVSLFVGGAFLLLSGNLAEVVAKWRSETKVMIYLRSDQTAADLEATALAARSAPWVTGVETVSAQAAVARFRALFPSLSDLVEDAVETPLPASIEVAFDPAKVTATGFATWIAELRKQPGVEMVDDDREWLGQLAAFVGLARAVGLGLGLVLLAAAIFTIASVVRLTAYLYSDEIAIMRLVGATEFFIRGPFYVEGLIQGFLGGGLAALALFAGFQVLAPRASSSQWGGLMMSSFLSWSELLGLVLLGALGGLVGAVASLRRERLEVVE